MACDGNIRVVSSKTVKDAELNSSVNRASLTILRTRVAASRDDPKILLRKAKSKCEYSTLNALKKLMKQKLVHNENACITDETLIDIGISIAEGIRAMPIVSDYPDW